MDPIVSGVLIAVGFFAFMMYIGRGLYTNAGDWDDWVNKNRKKCTNCNIVFFCRSYNDINISL